MSATIERITLGDLEEMTGLPMRVLRSFLDRHDLLPRRSYPRQWRTIDAADLPRIRQALEERGYRTKG